MKTLFSTRSMISQAWNTFKKHWKFIIPAGIVTTIISLAAQSLSGPRDNVLITLIGLVISTVVSIIIGLGWSQVMIRLIRNNKSDWNDFKTKPELWGRYFLVSLLYGIGLLLFIIIMIIGGIIGFTASLIIIKIIGIILGLVGLIGVIWLAIRMMFLPLVVIDNQNDTVKSLLKKSFSLTKGHVCNLVRLGLWQFLVIIAGIIALVIGLVIAIPVVYISTVLMYEHVKSVQDK